MGVYDRTIASAKRLIAAKGEPCVWLPRPAAVVDDAAKPWIETTDAQAPVVTYPNTAIAIFPLDRRYAELFRYLKDSDVVMGTVYGLMAVQSFVPKMTDLVQRKDGSMLAITAINPLAPNGDTILYTIEFKT